MDTDAVISSFLILASFLGLSHLAGLLLGFLATLLVRDRLNRLPNPS
jgi:hypothetical protein